MRLTAIVHREGDWYIATNPETGTTTQGSTFEEALANLREATELFLEEFPLSQAEPTILTTFDVASPSHA
jgi:predicted RNase H-like HicB family nuclease